MSTTQSTAPPAKIDSRAKAVDWSNRERFAFEKMQALQERLHRVCNAVIYSKSRCWQDTALDREVQMLAVETHAAQDAWLAIVEEGNK